MKIVGNIIMEAVMLCSPSLYGVLIFLMLYVRGRVQV